MPITVQHAPSYKSVGQVASGIGAGKRAQEDAIRQQARDDANRQFASQMQMRQQQMQMSAMESEAQRDFQREMFGRRADAQTAAIGRQEADRDAQHAHQTGIIDQRTENQKAIMDAQAALRDRALTTQQAQRKAKLDAAVAYLEDSQELSPEQKEQMRQRLFNDYHGLRQQSQPKDQEWPTGQEPGKTWIDKSTDALLTREKDGNVRTLEKSQKMTQEKFSAIRAKIREGLIRKTPKGEDIFPSDADVDKAVDAEIAAYKRHFGKKEDTQPKQQYEGTFGESGIPVRPEEPVAPPVSPVVDELDAGIIGDYAERVSRGGADAVSAGLRLSRMQARIVRESGFTPHKDLRVPSFDKIKNHPDARFEKDLWTDRLRKLDYAAKRNDPTLYREAYKMLLSSRKRIMKMHEKK